MICLPALFAVRCMYTWAPCSVPADSSAQLPPPPQQRRTTTGKPTGSTIAHERGMAQASTAQPVAAKAQTAMLRRMSKPALESILQRVHRTKQISATPASTSAPPQSTTCPPHNVPAKPTGRLHTVATKPAARPASEVDDCKAACLGADAASDATAAYRRKPAELVAGDNRRHPPAGTIRSDTRPADSVQPETSALEQPEADKALRMQLTHVRALGDAARGVGVGSQR